MNDLTGTGQVRWGERVRAHIAIMRLDHCVKQIFVLPGVVAAVTIAHVPFTRWSLARIVLGLVGTTLIASSNYTLNEMLDAPYDRLHPTKRARPAARGVVHFGAGYVQWIVLMAVGLAIGNFISKGFMLSALALWVMGCVYNIPPVRSKDLPYLDVISESINNPLRFLLGWYAMSAFAVPPVSLLIAYWLLGAYFMALKRFSEYRQIGDAGLAGSYRRSFKTYTEQSLLNSVVFYAASSMLFFGSFVMRYRLELILSFPLIALLMALYFSMSFEHESAAQNPEKLYREPYLMVALGMCVAVLVIFSFVNLPWLAQLFPKSAY
jgi:decaprenyl-phosphate phosphoribosyltransferase